MQQPLPRWLRRPPVTRQSSRQCEHSGRQIRRDTAGCQLRQPFRFVTRKKLRHSRAVAADDFVTSASTGEYGAGCRISLRIRGIINREGAALFPRVVDRATALEFRVTSLGLDSRGGDADAAISMARLIRQSEIFSAGPVNARIAEDHQSVCFSACVVLFSAADDQELEFNINGGPDLPSRIGIHGPWPVRSRARRL